MVLVGAGLTCSIGGVFVSLKDLIVSVKLKQ